MASQPLQSTTSSATGRPALKRLLADLFNCFRSIQLAVVLLSLLAVGTIIGVVMPQEGMVDIADIEKQFGPNFGFYRELGFFTVYSSFWFVTLEILFFFNLLIGSFKWLKPATLAALHRDTLPSALVMQKPEVHALVTSVCASPSSIQTVLDKTLKRFKYTVFKDDSGNLYATKGQWTRFGPTIAHIGILLCLIAGVYSAFTGFKAVKMVTPGDSFTLEQADTFKANMPEPLWRGSVPDWKIKVTDFRVDFYEDHPETARQYFSDLEVYSPEGKALAHQTISVNHPLIFDNLSIYQASFAPTGRFIVEINGKRDVLEANSEFNQRPIAIRPLDDGSALIMFPFFAGQDPGVSKTHGIFFVRRPGEAPPQGKMPENLKLNEDQSGRLKGVSIRFVKPEMATGLQIKRAPEVPLMYLSYLIISLGTVLCFFSQRQIWVSLGEVSPGQYQVLISPKTNKARLAFKRELYQLEEAMTKALQPLLAPERQGGASHVTV